MGKENLAGPIYSVAKALSLLEEISRHPDGISLIDISNAFKLEKSSVFRILETLENNGFIIKTSNPIRYMLGLKLFRLGMCKQVAMPFRKIAVPFLKELRDITGETVVLATIELYDMFYIEVEECSSMLRCSIDLSKSSPAFCDAVGKVLLAYKDDEYLVKYFKHKKLVSFTPHTIKKFDGIKKDFQTVKSSGVAIEHEEKEIGIHGIAAPVRHLDPIIGASIGIIYPACRYSAAREKELTEKVKTAAEKLSKAACLMN